MSTRRTGMDTVRRLYLYVMSGIALVFMAIGATNLLQIGIVSVLEAISDRTWSPAQADWERERLSLAIPFLVIAIPVWFFHWRMIERSLRGEDGPAERDSVIRGLFFFAVLAFTAMNLTSAIISAVDWGLRDQFGLLLNRFEREEFASLLAPIVVVGGIWLFHLLVTRRDAAAAPMTERGPLLPQLYLHAAAGIGVILALFGTTRMLEVAHTATLGDAPAGLWWQGDLATAIAMFTGGFVLALANWFVIERLLAGNAWWGRSEREAELRHAAWTVFLVATAFFVLLGTADAIAELVRGGAAAGEVIKPLGLAITFAGGWLSYRWRLLGEGPDRAGPTPSVVRHRLHDYGMALLGLGWAGAGLVRVIATFIERTTDGNGNLRDALAWPVGALAVGAAFWAWHWWTVQRRLGREPEAEQASAIRRGYLLAALGASIVAVLVGLTTSAYQALQRVLDVANTGPLARDLDWPLALAATGLVAGLFHGLLLRRDLKVRPLLHAAVATTRLTLALTGPPAGDIRGVVDTLRDTLPEGYAIEIVEGAPREAPSPAPPAATGTGLSHAAHPA